jgi:hypothetical protein
MNEEDRSAQEREYEPPQVEDVPAEDGPAVTAAGHSPPPDQQDVPN